MSRRILLLKKIEWVKDSQSLDPRRIILSRPSPRGHFNVSATTVPDVKVDFRTYLDVLGESFTE